MISIGGIWGTLVTDFYDFGKMTIHKVFIGCNRGTLVTDVEFGKMTICI